MKSTENKIGMVTLDLPYAPDIKVNLMTGKIEGKSEKENGC